MLRRLPQYLRQAKKPAQPPLNTPYFERFTKHRSIMPLYELWPNHGRSFVAPNATVVGEVEIGHESAVLYGAVLRGDINSITVMDYSFIGDNTVIHTAASLPTGSPASVMIGNNCYIGPRCTLYSCVVDDFATVGAGSIILEGAKLEPGCMVAPGSVVPPGRLIPAKQLWAGNPVQYVKDLYEFDEIALKEMLSQEGSNVEKHMLQFQDFGHAHMHDS